MTSSDADVAPPALKAAFDWKWIVMGTAVAVTVYIAIVPLGFLLWQSILTPQTATTPSVFTLGNYTAAYGSSDTWRLFGTSIQDRKSTRLNSSHRL